MTKKTISLLSLVLAAVCLLTGCASREKPAGENEYSLQIVIAAPYITDEHARNLENELSTALPALSTDSKKLSIQYIALGDGKTDPVMMVGGTTKIAAMFAGKEIDLLICDADNARRYGENGESYVALDTLFTPEEQQALGIQPACVPILDEDGNETGEMSAPCGVDLTTNATVIRLLGAQGYSAYVIKDQANIENAKAVIRHLVTMK